MSATIPSVSVQVLPITPLQKRAQRRGGASIEALLVISMLVLLWSGIFYLGSLHALRQRARSHARACTFIVSATACSDIPSDCKPAHSSPSDKQAAQLTAQADQATEDVEFAAPLQEEISSQLGGGLFARVDNTFSHTRKQPRALGGRELTVSDSFSLPCDAKPGSFREKLAEMFLGMFKKLRKDES